MSSLAPLGAPDAPAPFGDTVLEEHSILDSATFAALGEQFDREAEARDALHGRARKLDQRTSALLFRMHNEGATEASALEITDIERELREAQAARRASSLRPPPSMTIRSRSRTSARPHRHHGHRPLAPLTRKTAAP